jgi:hypothetical protein
MTDGSSRVWVGEIVAEFEVDFLFWHLIRRFEKKTINLCQHPVIGRKFESETFRKPGVLTLDSGVGFIVFQGNISSLPQ